MEKESQQFLLSMFPLPEVVMFPGMNLPLHIFEDSYKQMINDCLAKDKIFGIVFAQGNSCADIGTIVEIIDVEKLDDGKFNLLTEGKKRFKIIEFTKKEPYYEAMVEDYVDDVEKITSTLKSSLSEVRKLSKKALKIFDKVSDGQLSKNIKLPDDPTELLFLIASNLNCSCDVKQTLLESRSLSERTKQILSLLKDEIKRLEIILKNKEVRDIVEKNGKMHF